MKSFCDLTCLNESKAAAVRAQLPSGEAIQESTMLAHALADPIRSQVMAALSIGKELCGCDLSWITRQPQNLLVHHLKVLKAAGLVQSRREGKLVFNQLTSLGKHQAKPIMQSTRSVAV